jgi:hypothetical protein
MIQTMESLAAAGDWDQAADCAASLRHALLLVPAHLRRESMLAAQRCLQQVRALADDAKSDVTDRLSALRRGRDATRAYTLVD